MIGYMNNDSIQWPNLDKATELERHFARDLRAAGWPAPLHDYRVIAEEHVGVGRGLRKRLKDAGLKDWRSDFVYPGCRIIFEVEGGTWAVKGNMGGRHVRGSGYRGDCEKYNALVRLGWRVFRYTSGMIKDGSAYQDLCTLLGTITGEKRE